MDNHQNKINLEISNKAEHTTLIWWAMQPKYFIIVPAYFLEIEHLELSISGF
jgi:hypothetical protein